MNVRVQRRCLGCALIIAVQLFRPPILDAAVCSCFLPTPVDARAVWIAAQLATSSRKPLYIPVSHYRATSQGSSFIFSADSTFDHRHFIFDGSRFAGPNHVFSGTKRDHPLGCGLGCIDSSPQGAALSGRDHECNGRLLGSIRWDHLDNGETKCERFVPVWWPLVRSIGVMGSCAASNFSLDVAALALALPAPVFIMI